MHLGDQEPVAVLLRVVVLHLDQRVDDAGALPSRQMEDDVDGVGNLVANGLIRQRDAALDHARREPGQRLVGGVGVDRRQRPGVSGVERLEQVERFPTSGTQPGAQTRICVLDRIAAGLCQSIPVGPHWAITPLFASPLVGMSRWPSRTLIVAPSRASQEPASPASRQCLPSIPPKSRSLLQPGSTLRQTRGRPRGPPHRRFCSGQPPLVMPRKWRSRPQDGSASHFKRSFSSTPISRGPQGVS
jgi:hypothetical protein